MFHNGLGFNNGKDLRVIIRMLMHRLQSLIWLLQTQKTIVQPFITMNYHNIITIEPDKRGGKPCIRRMRITVYDGMSHAEILEDFPELTEEDIRACLEFAADREHCLAASAGAV
jgi:uncharacterized protein (DUF433 family)